jgi:hypothetical protein
MRALTVAAGFFVAAALVPLAGAEADRSAAIRQVTRGATLAERSSAALDQIAPGQVARGKVEQIDPSLALKVAPESETLSSAGPGPSPSGCVLTPEQQAIVTSLESQGRLPAGDCEMAAWFTRPQDKSEAELRANLAEPALTAAPELAGREAEADREASLAAAQREAAATATVTTTYFTPAAPVPAGD